MPAVCVRAAIQRGGSFGNGIEALEMFDEQERRHRSRGVRRGDAGDGRPHAAASEMRKPQSGYLKIIFVSGYAEEAFEKSLPENQQFAFLAKPFALERADRQGQGNHDGLTGG